jgi:hypothetical protein
LSEDPKVTIAGIKGLTDVSETSIQTVGKIITSMDNASKANPLMGIVSALFHADLFQKLGLMYPNTAQALREAVFQAIGLNFSAGYAANLKAWESAIPLLGFFTTTTNIQYESILKTTLQIDATGGETIVREAVQQERETLRSMLGGGEQGTRRLTALMKLLETTG